MADTNVAPPAQKKSRRWLKILGALAGTLLVLVVVLYLVATSSGFFTGFILPRVGKSMNATVTVSEAAIHPFSEVVLKNLKVQTTGAEPLVTAGEVHLRYSLMDIIGGKFNVAEVTLASPTVTLVENADGTHNYDPLTKGQPAAPKETKPAAPAKPGKAMQVDLKKFALTGATIRKVKLYANGNRDVTELSNVNVTLNDVKNGQAGNLELSADVKLDNHPPAPGAAGSAEAKLSGKFDFGFSPDLKPGNVKGNVHFQVNNAQGALAELATFASDLDCEMSPTEIKQLALRFAKGTAQLGEVRVSGPLDMEKSEGRLALQILGIDKRLLNLAGVSSGLDFGTTTISASNVIQLAKSGKAITASGHLDVNQFQVTRTGQTTPQMDLHLQYATDVDLATSNAVLRELVFTGTQKGNPLLRADLGKPMSFAWGAGSAVPDSTLILSLKGFNIADWQAVLGTNISAGTIDAACLLLSQKGGELMSVNGNVNVAKLIMNAQPNQSGATPLAASLEVKLDYSKKVADISLVRLSLTPTDKAANQLTLTGRVDMTQAGATSGNLKLTADALDFTTYYDTFFAGTNAPATGAAAAPAAKSATLGGPAVAASGPAKELEPMKLPFHNLTFEANIGRVYLHEVEITNLQAAAKLESGSAAVTPFKFMLNGAPVTASFDTDVSIPGFKYNLTFNAQKVPLAPLVNSFQPERKGQISGTVIAEANISGIGTTGENLQKNLKGNFNFHSTNLNLSIKNIQNKILKGICEVIVTIPSIAANPTTGLGNLAKSLTGQGSSGSSDELKNSIINAIVARGTAGSGRVDLQETSVDSPAFRADATGTVTLDAILTNSAINIPVGVSLERATSSRLGLLPANTPTNATYAKLPDFFSMKGTVGAPKKDIDPKPLLKLALQSAGSAIGGNTGSQLQSLGNLLNSKSSSNASGTNSTANSANSLLQGAESLFNRNRNSSTTNAASTNRSSNPLDQFLKPKNK